MKLFDNALFDLTEILLVFSILNWLTGVGKLNINLDYSLSFFQYLKYKSKTIWILKSTCSIASINNVPIEEFDKKYYYLMKDICDLDDFNLGVDCENCFFFKN